MKNFRLLSILLCVFVLAACVPPTTPTSPPDVEEPVESPAEPEPLPEEILIVSSTSDSGPGSLRQTMESGQSGFKIIFDLAIFPPSSPATIFVLTDLPGININDLTLDASNAGVILDGSQIAGDWNAGLQITGAEGVKIMGFQITNFPGPGIAISGDSNHNIVGGDRSIGSGPYGQGNLLSNNIVGVDIATEGTKYSIVTGNLIGVDTNGADWLGNQRNGISIWEDASENTIGPDNIIANNGELGIYTSPEITQLNTITQNDIFDNGIGRGQPAYPSIFDFDINAGTATGATCPNCSIDFFSTSGYEGEILEAETTADELGVFTINKGEAFTGPFLDAKVTDTHGNTSSFSWPPTSQTAQNLVLQAGNTLPRIQFFFKLPKDIADNHIATQYDGIAYEDDFTDLAIYSQGVTHARVSTNGIEPETDDWTKPEMPLSQAQQDHFTRMADEGIIVTYVLVFWDKENYPGGDDLPCYRFHNEEGIEAWLDYVRYIVETLHDRVQYFEIWNEPDIRNYCPKSIYLDDYINLIKRTAPVIHEIAPDAKVIVGGVSGTAYDDSYNYLLGVLRSDAMPLVDVVGWHPMYNFTPNIPRFRNYYFAYPDKIQEIKDTAEASGFTGEYHATEISFRKDVDLGDEFYEFTQIAANKYFLQSAIMHRGEDIEIGLGSGYFIIHRLSTAMAGVEPDEFAVDIETSADHLVSYTFSTLGGEKMVGLWRNTETSEFDPGIEATLTIPDTSASRVVVIDLLYNLEQELNFEIVDGDLVIENLLVKDYPIMIKLIHTTQ
ncbi:MAG: right-handed parallel beta-helix repeat-containing protein [Anaerolineaceae bacterium]|nr:right-handed parallel beta-helix repeat-containing protein [Anaerolineaceae bacterium]